MSLKQKLILVTLISGIIIYGITLSYILINLKSQNRQNAEEIVKNKARLQAELITKELNLDMGLTRGMATGMLSHKGLSSKEKKNRFDNIINHGLNLNPNYKGVWYSWQLSYFDPLWGNKPGRVNGATFRDENKKLVYVFDSIDIGGIKKRTNYHKMMDNPKETIMEPYNDRTTGILETTLAFPIMTNNKFSGLVGIDITLEHFQEIVKNIKLYENGYAFLMSNGAKYVYHPDTVAIGTIFSDLNPSEDSLDHISEIIAQGNEFLSYDKHSDTNDDILFFLTPVHIGQTGTPWSLGIIVYMSDVLKDANKIILNTMIVGIIGLFLMLAILTWFTNNVFNSINKGVEFANQISSGNLTAKLDVHSKDEIGTLAEALRTTVARFREMVNDMKKSAAQMTEFSTILNERSKYYAQYSNAQKKAEEEVSAALNDMSDNIRISHSNTSTTKAISQKAMEELTKGNDMIIKTVDAMKEIAARISVIGEIAAKTDLLAINAAIEASRAGTHGVGFAVVAGEVRKLSEKSAQAAGQINHLTKNGLTISTQTGEMVKLLLPEIEKTASLVEKIAELSNEQTANIDNIIRAMNELSSISEQNSGIVEQMGQNAEDLNQLAKSFSDITAKFKV